MKIEAELDYVCNAGYSNISLPQIIGFVPIRTYYELKLRNSALWRNIFFVILLVWNYF